jgi:hypothetical protein
VSKTAPDDFNARIIKQLRAARSDSCRLLEQPQGWAVRQSVSEGRGACCERWSVGRQILMSLHRGDPAQCDGSC